MHPITGNIPLQIHHIDGDATNNKEENLQLLCPNCHTLTENYGSLNKNATRVDTRRRY
jgi:predicted HNH restriction endonuclease